MFRPQGRDDDKRSKDIIYRNSYRFDIIKSRRYQRETWIHLTEGMPGAKIPGYAQNEIQVAPKDRIVIAFCFYNLNGLVDLESLEWAPP